MPTPTRMLVALVLGGQPAVVAADPPPQPPAAAAPKPSGGSVDPDLTVRKLIESVQAQVKEAWASQSRPYAAVTKAPAFGGGVARGMVIDPGPHPDDRMVIVPPDVGDRMVIVPGTNQLPEHADPSLRDQLIRGLGRGFDMVWELVRPNGT